MVAEILTVPALKIDITCARAGAEPAGCRKGPHARDEPQHQEHAGDEYARQRTPMTSKVRAPYVSQYPPRLHQGVSTMSVLGLGCDTTVAERVLRQAATTIAQHRHTARQARSDNPRRKERICGTYQYHCTIHAGMLGTIAVS